MKDRDAVLKRYFPKIPSFRGVQEEAIDSALQGKNTLCLMPTGEGKSLVYQVSGLCLGKTTIVISPLIALMKQHNDILSSIEGISCVFFSEYYDTKKQHKVMREMINENPDFIFISPERAAFEGFLEYILIKMRDKIGLVVIDEAHCVSQWGHGFRPAYKMIPDFLNRVFGITSWPTILCLTATLNPNDKEEICKDFKIDVVNQSSTLYRSNLNLEFCTDLNNEEDKNRKLQSIFNLHEGEKILVFAHRKRGDAGTRKLSELFKEKGYDCDYFDADASEKHKAEVLDRFINGDLKIVIATSAFGMGIDIPDIRVVVHYLLPESVEQYYQEVGRAGRDKKEAYGYLFYTNGTKKSRERLIKRSLLSTDQIVELYNKLPLPRGLDIGCINVWDDLNEEEKTAFMMLYRYRIIDIFYKGYKSFDCFKEKTKNGILSEYRTKSRGLSALFLHNKTGKSIMELTEPMYNLYSIDDITLEKAPVKAVFFKIVDELKNETLEEIETDQKNKLEHRLENFQNLVTGIEGGKEPSNLVKDFLGI